MEQTEIKCLWKGCNHAVHDTMQLKNHIEHDHLGANKGSYRCEWDGCRFGERRKIYDLKTHVTLHHQHLSYFCPNCGKGFLRDQELRKHKVVGCPQDGEEKPLAPLDFKEEPVPQIQAQPVPKVASPPQDVPELDLKPEDKSMGETDYVPVMNQNNKRGRVPTLTKAKKAMKRDQQETAEPLNSRPSSPVSARPSFEAFRSSPASSASPSPSSSSSSLHQPVFLVPELNQILDDLCWPEEDYSNQDLDLLDLQEGILEEEKTISSLFGGPERRLSLSVAIEEASLPLQVKEEPLSDTDFSEECFLSSSPVSSPSSVPSLPPASSPRLVTPQPPTFSLLSGLRPTSTYPTKAFVTFQTTQPQQAPSPTKGPKLPPPLPPLPTNTQPASTSNLGFDPSISCRDLSTLPTLASLYSSSLPSPKLPPPPGPTSSYFGFSSGPSAPSSPPSSYLSEGLEPYGVKRRGSTPFLGVFPSANLTSQPPSSSRQASTLAQSSPKPGFWGADEKEIDALCLSSPSSRHRPLLSLANRKSGTSNSSPTASGILGTIEVPRKFDAVTDLFQTLDLKKDEKDEGNVPPKPSMPSGFHGRRGHEGLITSNQTSVQTAMRFGRQDLVSVLEKILKRM